MKKQTLTSLLQKWPPELKSIVKDVYNQLNDVRVFSIDDIQVTDKEFNKLIELTQKINQGEDITFEIGYRYFRGNKLKLKQGVFVPQYDTEQIIDLVLERITEGKFIEVGTGSGAIPIALVNETNMSGMSIDINPLATELAKENFESNFKGDVSRLEFVSMDIFNVAVNEKVDLIISNPPYIKYDDEFVNEWVRDNQPKEALYADDDGLAVYKQIFNEVPNILNENGYIILEIGYDQGESVSELAKVISNEVEVIKDYEQHDRFVVVRYNGK